MVGHRSERGGDDRSRERAIQQAPGIDERKAALDGRSGQRDREAHETHRHDGALPDADREPGPGRATTSGAVT